MVSGLPAAYRSSGRQSAPARLWPCRAASAAASCRLSRIGIGGSWTRAGRSPSQACSSRREVSSTLHRVLLGQVAQQVRQVVLLGRGPVAGGAGREPGDRLDVVPHPQHRHLRQHLQHQVPPLGRVGDRRPGDAVGLQQRRRSSPRRCRSPGRRSGGARTRTTAPPPAPTPGDRGGPGRRWPGTSGRTPPPSTDLPAPAKACSSTTGWVSNARSRASSVSSRPKNPASGGRGTPPAPAPPLHRPGLGGGELDQRRRAFRRAQQHQRRGLVDDRDGPVLQRDRRSRRSAGPGQRPAPAGPRSRPGPGTARPAGARTGRP